jgi:hypothetical protein
MALTFGFVVLCFKSNSSPEMVTIAVAGIAVSAAVACIGFLAALLTIGTCMTYFRLLRIKKGYES